MAVENPTLPLDLRPHDPTTRDLARLVKAGGVEALPSALRRADDARYQEIRCRSALNRVEGMPFRWTLNAYRGCTHGCHYCFARKYQSQLELPEGDAFASVIYVKANLIEVLTRELDRPTWQREVVAVGTATDPYQPIEGHYQLTRRSLQALAASATPIGLVTKGPMVVRDIDVLQDVARRAHCTVYMSVPTVDDEAWRVLEPGTAPPLQRLRAVRALVDAGIDAGVLMAPLVPGFSTHPARLERTIAAVADHGARFVGANLLHLEGGTRTHFMRFLGAAYPHLVERYERLYAAKYAPKAYSDEVKKTVAMLRARHAIGARTSSSERAADDMTRAEVARTPPPAPSQGVLWPGDDDRR